MLAWLLAIGIPTLLDQGHYGQAEIEASRRFAAARRQGSPKDLARAGAIYVGALVANGKGPQDATLSLARELQGQRLELLGSAERGVAVWMLGAVLASRGDSEGALERYQAALAEIEGRRLPVRDLVGLLCETGAVLTALGRYPEASTALTRALGLARTRLEPGHDRSVSTLELLGRLRQEQGDYAGARPLLEQALRLRRLTPGHPGLASAVDAYGDQLWFEGDRAGARQLYDEAVSVAVQTLQPRHPKIAAYLGHAVEGAADAGDLQRARSLAERALELARSALGLDHPELAWRLNALANLDLDEGDWVAARAGYEQALAITARRLGPTHVNCATFLHNLAIASGLLGDLERSHDFQHRAMGLWSRWRGPEHPYLSRAVEMWAKALASARHYREAAEAHEQALAMRERIHGPNHREVALSLTNLAVALEKLGARARARAHCDRALTIWGRLQAQGNPDHARMLALSARLHSAAGELGPARQAAGQALEIRQRLLGAAHPETAESHLVRAEVLAASGEPQAAMAEALAAEVAGREHQRLTCRSLHERQALSYAAIRPAGLDLALSLLASGQADTATAEVLDAVVLSRALVLDEMASRQRVAAGADDTEVSSALQLVTRARKRLANLVQRGPADDDSHAWADVVVAARSERDVAEEALAARSRAFREDIARSRIGLAEVRAALPAGTALVSFVRYDDGVGRGPRVGSYAAFVVAAGDGPASFVALGPANELEAALEHWRREVVAPSTGAGGNLPYLAAAHELSRRVLEPLWPRLTGTRRLLIVPDGLLGGVSFAALFGPSGRYLVEDGPTLQYLSAERDIATPRGAFGQGLLALGAPEFDSTERPAVRSSRLRSRRPNCADKRRFEMLPGTGIEVERVRGLWASASAGSPADVLTGTQAAEERFKALAPGRRVLHLATHGFAANAACTRRGLDLAGDPLLDSGLALAGANRRQTAGPDEEDGILTGEEIAVLDLGGVEWAVLSACETGLGQVRAGEGVLGLRRAFQVAGVRSVIMSLWAVEDEAAAAWMEALYTARFRDGLDTADSVRRAMLALLERGRRRHDPHPFDWAGFVAVGEWR